MCAIERVHLRSCFKSWHVGGELAWNNRLDKTKIWDDDYKRLMFSNNANANGNLLVGANEGWSRVGMHILLSRSSASRRKSANT